MVFGLKFFSQHTNHSRLSSQFYYPHHAIPSKIAYNYKIEIIKNLAQLNNHMQMNTGDYH